METRRGRRPMAAGHVEHLSGSELAKLRLNLILRTMLGELSVAEACAELHVGESRFHALRTQWLQESLELLEPRPTGRPPKDDESSESSRITELETKVRELQCRLGVAETREEVTRILGGSSPTDPGMEVKKTGGSAAAKRWLRLRRRQQQRQRM